MKAEGCSLVDARPRKPEWGARCNGCGVCCMAQTCRLGLKMHGETDGPCPSLSWDGERFRCGLVAMDSRVKLLLGIGYGCDSDAAPEGHIHRLIETGLSFEADACGKCAQIAVNLKKADRG